MRRDSPQYLYETPSTSAPRQQQQQERQQQNMNLTWSRARESSCEKVLQQRGPAGHHKAYYQLLRISVAFLCLAAHVTGVITIIIATRHPRQ